MYPADIRSNVCLGIYRKTDFYSCTNDLWAEDNRADENRADENRADNNRADENRAVNHCALAHRAYPMPCHVTHQVIGLGDYSDRLLYATL